MCGIAGIVDFEKPVESARLGRMLKCIVHRGPDDEGRYDDEHMAIGMRRLSIIDLEGGHQPIANEDGTIWVVLNGEVYNYLELRADLEARGHIFKTQTDTEVLVHLYEEHGERFPEYLNGMFGLAVWDLKNHKVILARDPMGIKPLYWHFSGTTLVFASEIKCLLQGGFPRLTVDRDAIAAYLHLGYIPRDRCPFREVERLLPGHCLVFQEGAEPGTKAYWRLRDAFAREENESEEELVEQALSLLEDAVRIRLRSDVPVGTFLSGGIDSSSVTVLAAAQLPQIDTFGVGFTDHFFDETPYARSVAAHAATRHHELIVDPMVLLDHLELLAWHLDEPNWDPAMLPSYVICKHAREHVKVALSGNGGDEVFAGYFRHFDPPPLNTAACYARQWLPRAARQSVLSVLAKLHPARAEQMARRFLPNNNVIGMAYWVDQADPGLLGDVAGWAVDDFSATAWIERVLGEVERTDWVNGRLYYDSTTYLVDQILNMIDRSSMAVSLEVRVPFLDTRLVELMAGVAGSRKIRHGEGKALLKRMMQNRLPDEIFTRRKLGFGAPVRTWVLAPRVEEYLRALPAGHLVSDGYLDGERLRPYLEDRGKLQHHCAFAWMVMMLELWYTQYVKGVSKPLSC